MREPPKMYRPMRGDEIRFEQLADSIEAAMAWMAEAVAAVEAAQGAVIHRAPRTVICSDPYEQSAGIHFKNPPTLLPEPMKQEDVYATLKKVRGTPTPAGPITDFSLD